MSLMAEASQSDPITDHLLGLETENSGLESFDISLCLVAPLSQILISDNARKTWYLKRSRVQPSQSDTWVVLRRQRSLLCSVFASLGTHSSAQRQHGWPWLVNVKSWGSCPRPTDSTSV